MSERYNEGEKRFLADWKKEGNDFIEGKEILKQGRYSGCFADNEAFARNWLVEVDGVPEHVMKYIDFDAYVEEVKHDYIFFPPQDGSGFHAVHK